MSDVVGGEEMEEVDTAGMSNLIMLPVLRSRRMSPQRSQS